MDSTTERSGVVREHRRPQVEKPGKNEALCTCAKYEARLRRMKHFAALRKI